MDYKLYISLDQLVGRLLLDVGYIGFISMRSADGLLELLAGGLLELLAGGVTKGCTA